MKKHLIEEAGLNDLLAFVGNQSNDITFADAAASTGLPVETCKQGLLELLCRYEGTLIPDLAKGSVRIKFSYPLKRRTEAKAIELVYKAFKVFLAIILASLKSITAILLLVIVFTFYIMPMLLVSIFSNTGKSSRNEKSFVKNFDFIYELKNLLYAVFSYTEKREIVVETNKKGRYYRRLGYTKRDSSTLYEAKSFSNIVFDFVFGTKRAVYRKRDLEARAAKLIAANQGIIAPEMLAALEGYSLGSAKEKMLEIVLNFGGQLEIDDNGSIYALFNDFEGKKVGYTATQLLAYYDEVEPPYLLTGNTKHENSIMAMALTMPIIVSTAWIFSDIRGKSTTVGFFDYIYYYVIGITAFIVLMPLFRLPFVYLANKTLNSKNKRRQAYKLIFTRIKSNKDIKFSDIKKIFGSDNATLKIIAELEGEIVINEQGESIVNFKNINNLKFEIAGAGLREDVSFEQ